MRQIVLDTETTGLEPEQGHRIIEVGCVELFERRPTGNNFHQYIQPDKTIDAGAVEVHGITNEFLADKPRFEGISDDLIAYLSGADLVIHNAPFDVGFLNAEFSRLDNPVKIVDICTVTDTLVMARTMHPGQRNSLDALCGRYDVSNAGREKHGALLDAEILTDVYLAMTGGQTALSLDAEVVSDDPGATGATGIRRIVNGGPLRVIRVNATEQAQHQQRLAEISQKSGKELDW